MTNITINIKNCGCGGSGAATETPASPFDETWGDPNSDSGPPEGFFEPTSGLSDRQCKAAVWLYDWLYNILDMLGNTTEGAVLLGTLRRINIIPSAALQAVILAALPTIFGLFTIPEPSDAVLFVTSWIFANSFISALGTVQAELITQALVIDALSVVQSNKNQIICQLSKAPDSYSASQSFQKIIQAQSDLTFEQKQIIVASMPRWMLKLLYWTSDFWPSFDDDYLAGITTTCCGSLVDGDPITAGSVEHCNASYYMIDQLAATFQSVDDLSGIWNTLTANPFDDELGAIYDRVNTNLVAPYKVEELATDWPAFLMAIASIIDSQQSGGLGGGKLVDLSDFGGLADYITANRATLTTALQTATTPSEAYTELQPLRDWINNNVGETDIQAWMQAALDAIIEPPDSSEQHILDLLFTQDSDLVGYVEGACAQGHVEFWDFTADEEGWVFNVVNDAGGTPVGSHEPDVLKIAIAKTSANGSNGEWRYTPPAGWIVHTGDTIRARVRRDVMVCTGMNIKLHFTDGTDHPNEYRDMTSPGWSNFTDVTLTVESDHDGKEIDYIALNGHSGSGCGAGSTNIYFDECEAIFQ